MLLRGCVEKRRHDFFGGGMKGFLVTIFLIGVVVPAFAADQQKDPAPIVTPNKNVLSVVKVDDEVAYIDNDFGISYERALNRWVSALGQIDYGQNEKYGATIEDEGVQLEARVYPFGKAPSGFFGNLRVRELITTITGAFPDNNGGSFTASEYLFQRWWGLGLGYQWIIFKVLALQASLTFDDATGTDLQLPAGSFRYHDKFGIGWAF
jgi:hypothetical protein